MSSAFVIQAGIHQNSYINSIRTVSQVGAHIILDKQTSAAVIRDYFMSGGSLNEVTDIFKERIRNAANPREKKNLREHLQFCVDEKSTYYKKHWVYAFFSTLFSNPIVHAEEAIRQSTHYTVYENASNALISQMEEMDRREQRNEGLFLREADRFRLSFQEGE